MGRISQAAATAKGFGFTLRKNFGGKVYGLVGRGGVPQFRRRKSQASSIAKRVRAIGANARIASSKKARLGGTFYAVYARHTAKSRAAVKRTGRKVLVRKRRK